MDYDLVWHNACLSIKTFVNNDMMVEISPMLTLRLKMRAKGN